ncbi:MULTISPECIES: hypothetical protein [Methanobacterium]|uniref:Uncharacterized protein n=1 Tax=Methanobacterium veterum TaxID=408577 RepID=A0A9E4ZVS9_9EURY|nr:MULTISPECIES: hypothetical protein [Methanobacterium]MCZ3366517.1 hypothetical protein [Methanobacterium veterum]MCZ3371774.1 hypothetical protein [Methanobacterium veterum]
MGYLICDTCNDVYKLQDMESPEEFDTCQCGGNLEYYETLQDFVSQFYDLSNFKSEEGNLLLKKGYNQLKKKNRDLKEDYSKLKDAKLELESEIQELKEFQNKLKDINAEVEEENLELKDKINSIRDRYLKLENKNSKSSKYPGEQLSTLKDNELETENSDVIDLSKKDNNSNSKEAPSPINKLDGIDSNLKKKLKELIGTNQKLKTELGHESLKLANLRKFNYGLETKNSELKQEILRLKEFEEAHKKLNFKYIVLEKHNQELINKHLELHENHKELEENFSKLEQENFKLKELAIAYEDLNQKYADLEKYNDKLLAKDAELGKSYNKLKDSFSRLEKENVKLSRSVSLDPELENKYNELDENYARLEEKFSKLEEENLKLKESANSNPELETSYNELQEKFSKLEEQNRELNSELSELKDNFSNLRETNLELKSFKDENEGLENKYGELLEKYSELEEKSSNIADLEKHNEELSNDNYRLETDFNELKAKLSELEEDLKVDDDSDSKLKTQYVELNSDYHRLKVDHFNLKERYLALKEKNKTKTITVDFSGENKDDASLKTHIVCEDCGQKLPLSQFYKTKSNERGYTSRCKSCTRKRNAAQGLVELSKYIDLDTPFSKDELKAVIGDQQFSVFENYMWVLLELDILTYLEDEDKYVLKSDDNLKGFCGTYGISLAL